MFGKKKTNKRSQPCRINGKRENHGVCFKDTDKNGVQFGYVRKNKTYIQVYQNQRGVWVTKSSFLASLFSWL